MKYTKEELVKAVKDHALLNYEKNGWDYVVECYTDADIAREIGNARTPLGAIRKIGAIVKYRDDYRKEIQSTAF